MTTATQKIPAGYKQTDIGVIPTDWDVKQLKSVISKVIDNRGKTPPYSSNPDIELIETTSISFVTQYPNYSKVTKFVSNKTYNNWFRGHPVKDDVLVSTVGEYSGSSAIMGENRGTIAQNLIALRIKDVNPTYVFYWTRSDSFREQLDQVMMSQAQPSLRVPWLLNFYLNIPSSKEQTAIVTILSDVNALIEKTGKLIEKKKNIKQGAMQELLTGKRRLPGFSGKWERKILGKLGDITGSGVDKKIRPDEVPVRLVNFLDVFHKSFIYSKDLHHQVTARPDQLLRCSVKKGDIFFTPSSEMPFDIGISAIAMEDIPDAVHSYHVDRLRLFEDWDLLFRAYIFQTKDFSNQTATQCEGSGKRYVLNLTTFRQRLTVYYPTDNKEQAAISKILFDIDTEIEKLESQLTKYQNIKQGMMQTLLTGKIRLIPK